MLEDAPRGGVPPERWRDRATALLATARAQPARLVAAMAAIVAIAGGLGWMLRPPAPITPETVLPVVTTGQQAGAGAAAPQQPSVPATVVVHVAGAVARPGVLHLPADARVVDAIHAAGGATLDADTDRINLAAPLADGARIHVPRAGELAQPGNDPGGAPLSPGAAAGPIDVNRASVAELETLPGIGPSIAAAIVQHRERNGPFRDVESLRDVPGIGEAKLARIRDLVQV